MYYLVYTKQKPAYGIVGLETMVFQSRREVLNYAIEAHIRLNEYDTVIIGPNGIERGSSDPHAELEKLEVANVEKV